MSEGRQSLSKCNPKAESDLLGGKGNTLDHGWPGWITLAGFGFEGDRNKVEVCLAKIKKPAYFTIQLIFTIICGIHCTF